VGKKVVGFCLLKPNLICFMSKDKIDMIKIVENGIKEGISRIKRLTTSIMTDGWVGRAGRKRLPSRMAVS